MHGRFRHVSFEDAFEVAAAPERVFPLLCPVREHDWIPTWRAEVVHSRSGLAELGCVFTTQTPAEDVRTWVCTRFEPNRALAYTVFSSLGYVMLLDITLTPRRGGDHCSLAWRRRFAAVDAAGNDWVAKLDAGVVAQSTTALATLLRHYLATGTMLRP